jgi:hypothetical protein
MITFIIAFTCGVLVATCWIWIYTRYDHGKA